MSRFATSIVVTPVGFSALSVKTTSCSESVSYGRWYASERRART
jgi:hypothetical protein